VSYTQKTEEKKYPVQIFISMFLAHLSDVSETLLDMEVIWGYTFSNFFQILQIFKLQCRLETYRSKFCNVIIYDASFPSVYFLLHVLSIPMEYHQVECFRLLVSCPPIRLPGQIGTAFCVDSPKFGY
jgi:hypothetical protein